jgi:hypothetical protein
MEERRNRCCAFEVERHLVLDGEMRVSGSVQC